MNRPQPPLPPFQRHHVVIAIHRHPGRGRAGPQLLSLVRRSGERGMTRPDTPFPKHWLYYIVLKYAVIAAAVLIALYVASQLL